MLVQHHAVEAKFVAVDLLVEVLVEDLGALVTIQKRVGQAEEAASLEDLVFRVVMVGAFGKEHYVHDRTSVGSVERRV